MIERSTGSETSEPNASAAPGVPKVGHDEAALSGRLERLGATLEARQAAEERAGRGKDVSGFAQATKIASEFVAGVIVGGGIGWAFDRALGTAPWGMIVFVLLGFAAGVLNVLRAEGVVADAGIRLPSADRKFGPPSDRSDG